MSCFSLKGEEKNKTNKIARLRKEVHSDPESKNDQGSSLFCISNVYHIVDF